MENLFYLFFCIFLGFVFSFLNRNDKVTEKNINDILFYILIPITSFLNALDITWNNHYFYAILVPWISFFFSILFFHLVKIPDLSTRWTLILNSSIPSISFIGFPIFELIYGKEGLKMGVVMSQLGSFLICYTVGTFILILLSNKKENFQSFARKILSFPAFLAFILGLLFNQLDVQIAPLILFSLQKLNLSFPFLALFSVGILIGNLPKFVPTKFLYWGLFNKLILMPFLTFILFRFVFRLNGMIMEVSVLATAIGPMNTMAILSIKNNLNPKLVGQLVSLGIVLSLAVLFIIHFVFVNIFQ